MASSNDEVDTKAARACDRCRQRKIRCDRKYPCANCRTAAVDCKTTETRKEPNGKRIKLSEEYHKKIDTIEERLSVIEDLLSRTTHILERTRGEGAADVSLFNVSNTENLQTTGSPTNVGRLYVGSNPTIGNASLLAHAQQAREELEKRLRSRPQILANLEVAQAFQELKAVTRAEEHECQAQTHIHGVYQHEELTLPPRAIIFQIMQQARDTDALFFMIWRPFFSTEHFAGMCRRLYDQHGDCKLAERTLLYGCLYYMIMEQATKSQAPPAHCLWEYMTTFKIKFEACLYQQRALTVRTDFDTILALTFGAVHAVQQAKFADAWACNTVASRLCQTLRWHRADTEGKIGQRERIIFFAIYYNDKCLSLRLGQSSTIQDWDVTANMPDHPEDPRYRSWSEWFRVLVDMATVHGEVYQHLFSPASFKVPTKQRERKASDAVKRLMQISADNTRILAGTQYRPQYMAFLLSSNEIVIGCLKTLVHRAASIGPNRDHSLHITDACLEAARATINSHLGMIDVIQFGGQNGGSPNDYAHWRLLNCPFTPFLVLFSHIIVSLDEQDLHLLRRFVQSLPSLMTTDPGPMTVFYKLCCAFFKLAEEFVNVETRRTGLISAPPQDSLPAAGTNMQSSQTTDFHDPAHEYITPGDAFDQLQQFDMNAVLPEFDSCFAGYQLEMDQIWNGVM